MCQTSAFDQDTKTVINGRLVELDWLRVLAFGLLIFYHLGMLYTQGWGWHYKSSYQSEFLANIMLWSNQWRMSLLFLISGAAVAFMLAKQGNWAFMGRRSVVLGLPLIFGMLVVVVPQVYVEANSTGRIVEPNFWRFWSIYLDQTSVEFAPYKTLGTMHLTWNHLWFLPYILAYSALFALFYPLLMHKCWAALRHSLSRHLTLNGLVVLPIALLSLNGALLYDRYPQTHNFVVDWFNHGRYLLAFAMGFVLVRLPLVWQRLAARRWLFLVLALIGCAYILCAFHGQGLGEGFWAKTLNGVLWSANAWLWIFTVLAWAQHLLRRSNAWLRYMNSGIYCFYILHQTLIIVLAYYWVPRKLGPVLEPLVLLVLVVLGCVLGYELVRRLPFIRILFGVHMRPQ